MPQVLPYPPKSSATDDKIKKDVFLLDLPPSSLLQQRPISPPSLCTPPRSPNFYHSHSNALSPIQPLSQQLALPFLSQQPSYKYISHTSDICKVDDAVGKSHETLVRRPETEPISLNIVPPRSPKSIEVLSDSKRRWCPLHGHMYCPSISPACAIDGSPCRGNTSEVANKLPGRMSTLESSSSNLVQRSFDIWLYSPHHGWYGRGRIVLPLVTITEIDSSFSPRPNRNLDSTTFYIHPDSILKAAIGVIKFRSLKKRKTLYGLGVVALSESNGVGALIRRYQWIPVALDANAVHFGIIVSDMPPARHRPHRQSRTTTTPLSASSSPPKHSQSSTKPPKPPIINPIDTALISDPKNHKTDSIRPIISPIEIPRISTAKPPLSFQSPPTPTSPISAGKFQTPESPGRIILTIFCTLAVSSYLIAFVTDQFADITVPFGGTQSGSSLTERKSSLLEFGSKSISRQIPFQFTSLVHQKPTPVISAFSPLHRDSGRTQDDLLPIISETPPCTTDTSVSAALWTVAIVASALLVLLIAVIATGFLYRRSSPNEKTRWQRRVSEISGKRLLQRPEWYLKRLRRGSVVSLARTGSDAARDSKGSSTMISGTTENYGCSSPTDPPILPVPGPLSKERYVDTPSSRPGVKVTATDCKTPPIPIITKTVGDRDTTILYPTSEQPLDPDDWEFALIHAARPRSWDGERTRLCTRR